MAAISRRHLLIGCSCFLGVDLLSGNRALAEDGPDSWFFCETPQITGVTDLLEIQQYLDLSQPGLMEFGNDRSGSGIDLYGLAFKTKRWRDADGVFSSNGRLTLRVGFVDGDNWQQGAVKDKVQGWLGQGLPIDLVFEKNSVDCEIRISFTLGNRSEYGRDARHIGNNAPTMYLKRCARDQPDVRVQAVVLHEFGHAVFALGHEHQHPDADLGWRMDKIVADTGWPPDRVRQQITEVYNRGYTCSGSRSYDRLSIMHYPIKPSWVRTGVEIPESTELSAGDVACARSVYGS